MFFGTIQFSNDPWRQVNGIPCFGNDDDGDRFDDLDAERWRGGGFDRNWNSGVLPENEAARYLAEKILNGQEYVIDLASGPGLGFIPYVKQQDPSFLCMASDANCIVLEEWKRYLEEKRICDICFAQFSLFDIPFTNGSVEAYSSFLGLSSTRNGEEGYRKALSEIYRTLAENGRFYTVESDWTEPESLERLLRETGRETGKNVSGRMLTWSERFEAAGFETVYEATYKERNLTHDDNDLGTDAEKLGIMLGVRYTAFILKKSERVVKK